MKEHSGLAALAIAGALLGGAASADPPDGNDAPDVPQDAVRIDTNAGTYDASLGGGTRAQDTDVYKFGVETGQTIDVICHERNGDVSRPSYQNVDVWASAPCVAMDPAGIPVAPSSIEPSGMDGAYVAHIEVHDAKPGDWLLVFSGTERFVDTELGAPGNYGWILESAPYRFSITLTPAEALADPSASASPTTTAGESDDHGDSATVAPEGGAGAMNAMAGLLFTILAVFRRERQRVRTLALRRWSRAAGVGAIVLSGAAGADPPYGEDFDAPQAFESAVLIGPNGDYEAGWEGEQDADFYKFGVAKDGDIHVMCARRTQSGTQPCVIELLDPDGVPRGTPATHTFGATTAYTTIDVEDAAAGDWRLRTDGSGNFNANYAFWAEAPYSFSVAVTVPGGAPASGDGSSAGAVSASLASLLWLASLIRRRWR